MTFMEIFVSFFQNKGKNMHLGNTIARKIYLPSTPCPKPPIPYLRDEKE
jgi:hypothetical protein